MKLSDIFALFALSVIVKGSWLAAAVQPVILSIGAVLTAIDLDVHQTLPFEWRNWQIFKSDKEETTSDSKGDDEKPSAKDDDFEPIWKQPGYE